MALIHVTYTICFKWLYIHRRTNITRAARPRDTFPLPVHNQLKPFCVTSTYTLIMRTLPDLFAKNATLYIQALLVSTEHCPIHLSYEQGFETRTSDSELHPKDN